ncbi:iron ABC transporter permease [Aquimarina sp. AD10]|uniref:Iron ABC transporter n=1 Tax=Aquimarina aggregata TaxID=1642818 RepID=A0A163BMM0_9FLAO|nr:MULTISPECIES: iron ABC transporter permease [Aquimarina]AXT59014.1 iron ABC transporter permease [Aquimarina sp. AD10]KZS41553.1 iron ABC transporter [Aquimarina aggregata]RKM95109.1 iron ABC transporter permease [Aquimarina sp. AD10]
MTPNKSYKKVFIGIIALLLLCFIANISLGSVFIPWLDTLSSLIGASVEKESWRHIVIAYRLPKALTAIIVGSGLGVSGLMMQTLFRNPLAGPFVLGISSGATLGVALLILGSTFTGIAVSSFLTSKWGLIIAASLGSVIVLFAVMIVSVRVKDTMAILIIGLMFGSITTAIVSVLSYFAPADLLQQYVFWGFGSLGNLSWFEVLIFFGISLFGLLLAIASIKPLNTLLLGENYARSLGLNIKTSRFLIIIATGLLAGSSTAFAGPIAFIGLAVPHLTRQLFHTSDHKTLIPAVILIGSIIMLICDSIAQLPSSEYTLPINAITSLIGAPVVIWLLVRKRKMLF